MVTNDVFCKLALSFPGGIELPHFEKRSFRLNKKIFATLDEKKSIAMVRFSLIDQSVFCDMNKGIIYPVPGGWGKQGATYINLKDVKIKVLKDALKCAYELVAKKKVSSTNKK